MTLADSSKTQNAVAVALTFGGGFAAYAGMDRIRHAPSLRLFFAALIAFALVLNGMGSSASASDGKAGGRSVIIAGTVITLCKYGSDDSTGNKIPVVHGCDQCALCATQITPTVDLLSGIERHALNVALRSPAAPVAKAQLQWLPAWPRGPPIA